MKFHPVVELPPFPAVLDFSRGVVAEDQIPKYAVGRYNERRPGVYANPELYQNERDHHVGIDLFAPVGTPIHAWTDGKIAGFAYHAAKLDYGNTLVTVHSLSPGVTLYSLYGHLSGKSLLEKKVGDEIKGGEIIAWIGDRQENGGWLPHLHFQLSFEAPVNADLPGVVSEEDLKFALLKYPDPRLVLGPIYG